MKISWAPLVALLLFAGAVGSAAPGDENGLGEGAVEERVFDRTGWPGRLVIAFPQSGTREETRARYEGLRAFLADWLGLEVEVLITDGYTPIYAGFSAGRIDAAYLGALSYIELGRYAEVEPAVMELNAGGQAGYHAVIVARSGAGLSRLEDGRGRVLALVDRNSTSGFLIPSHHLITALKTPPGVFASKVVFAGTHDEVIKGVAQGRYDLGATNDIDLARSCQEHGYEPDSFTLLWKSELFPASPYAARKGLPPSLREAFKQAMLEINHQPEIKSELGIGGFAPADHSAYEPVRELMKVIR